MNKAYFRVNIEVLKNRLLIAQAFWNSQRLLPSLSTATTQNISLVPQNLAEWQTFKDRSFLLGHPIYQNKDHACIYWVLSLVQPDYIPLHKCENLLLCYLHFSKAYNIQLKHPQIILLSPSFYWLCGIAGHKDDFFFSFHQSCLLKQ